MDDTEEESSKDIIILKTDYKHEDYEFPAKQKSNVGKYIISITHRALQIPQQSTWRLTHLILIFANYILITYGYVFVRGEMTRFHRDLIHILDGLYALDFVLTSTYVLMNKFGGSQEDTGSGPIVLLLTESLVVFPYSDVYKLVMNRSTSDATFFVLRAISFLRLLHLLLFFHDKSRVVTPVKRPWKYFVLQQATMEVLLVHTFACVWCYLSHPFTFKTDNKTSDLNHYSFYLYKALMNFLPANFGHTETLNNNNSAEKTISSLSMLMGFCVTTVVLIGALASIFINLFRRQALLGIKLHNALKHLNAPLSTANRIRTFYGMLWSMKKGKYRGGNELPLPAPFKAGLCLDIAIDLIRCCKVFEHQSEAVLKAVATMMRQEVYQSGEIIYIRNILKDKMIFVKTGGVEVASSDDDENQLIAFGPGTCLGESALVLSLNSNSNMKATQNTELQVLYRSDFIQLAEMFPKSYATIRKTILARIEETKANKGDTKVHHNLHIFQSSIPKLSVMESVKEKLDEEENDLALHRLRKDNNRGDNNYSLVPDYPFIRVWENFIIITVAAFIALVYPYYICFVKDFPFWLILLSKLAELILVLDVVVILKFPLETPIHVNLAERLKELGFYLDLLSSVCVEFFSYPFNPSTNLYYALKINRLLKVYRICKLFQRLERNLEIVTLHRIRVFKYVVYMIICGYWSGSLLYWVTCFEWSCNSRGWYLTNVMAELFDKNGTDVVLKNDNFVVSLYFGFSTFTGVTFGDILPPQLIGVETLIIWTIITLGIFIFGFYVAQATAGQVYKMKTMKVFKRKLRVVQKFGEKRKLDETITNRVTSYLKTNWQYNECLNNYCNNSTRDIFEVLTKTSFFFDTSPDFIQLLATVTQSTILPPNEVLFYNGTKNPILYIVQEGFCMRHYGNYSTVLGPYSYFGSLSVLFETSCSQTVSAVKTLTHARILYVTYGDFWRCMSVFPEVEQIYRETVKVFEINEEVENLRKQKHVMPSYFEEIDWANAALEGNIVDVMKYCKAHNENYTEPFSHLGFLWWSQFLIPPICILPNGQLLKIWLTMRTLVALIIAMLTPYQQLYHPYSPVVIDKIMLSVLIISYMDLYIMLLVGYYDSKTHHLVIHPLKTACHYLRGRFLIDFSLCVPWELLAKLINPNGSREDDSYRVLNCLLAFIKVAQIYRLPELIHQFTETFIIRTPLILHRVGEFVTVFFVVMNFWALLWISNGCVYYKLSDVPRSDWINKSFEPLQAAGVGSYTLLCKSSSKLSKFVDPFKAYTFSTYSTSSILSRCGFGDVTPESTSELVLTIIIILCGLLLVGYFMAQIAGHRLNFDLIFPNYIKQELRLKDLEKFMARVNVPSETRYDVTKRIERKCSNVNLWEFRQILCDLPPLLHEDAAFYIFQKTLKRVLFFEDMDHQFFRLVAKGLKIAHFASGEQIYADKDVVSKIYVVDSGKVIVISKFLDKQYLLGHGGVFGNITPRDTVVISKRVTALTPVDLLYMETKRFYHILKDYPEVMKKFEDGYNKGANFIIPHRFSKCDIQSDTSETDSDTFGEYTSKPGSQLPSKMTLEDNLTDGGRTSLLGSLRSYLLSNVAKPPRSFLINIYDHFCRISAYVNMFLVTYHFSFQHHCLTNFILAGFIDIVFLVRLILSMQEIYQSEYKDEAIKKRNTLILGNKLRIFCELLTDLPVFYFSLLIPSTTDNAMPLMLFSSLRLVSFFRFVHLVVFLRRKNKDVMVNKIFLILGNVFTWYPLLLHVFACAWYILACPMTFCLKDSWVKNMPKEKNNAYLSSLYFIIEVFTTASTGDIVATNTQEEIFVALLMISMVVLTGFLIGDVINIFNYHSLKIRDFNERYESVYNYFENGHVSDYQRRELKLYVRKIWRVTDGINIKEAISYLPPVMKCNLLHSIYGPLLRESFIFAEADDNFLRLLCARLNVQIILSGNYIVEHGDVDMSMYFIYSGKVDILTVYSELEETTHEVLSARDMFGLVQGLFYAIPHHFSFRANGNVHAVGLCLKDWEDLLNVFPTTKNQIYSKVNDIYNNL